MFKTFCLIKLFIYIFVALTIKNLKKMPVARKSTKGPEPKAKVSSSKSSNKVSLGNGKKGTIAQADSAMMSRGMTPRGGSYYFPKSKSEKEANQSAAAKSNPAKTGVSPRGYQGVSGVKPKKK